MKVVQGSVYNYNHPAFFGYAEAMRYANRTRLYNQIANKKLYECNLEKLEGIQEGLKTFDGLSMKQIAFALTDLHSINMIRGCINHCLHCYANAQPFITRSLFESFKQIMDDIKTLRSRIGINPVSNRGSKYIDCYFDSDGLEMYLFDKNGNLHDAVELGKMIHESTGMKTVFDTSGWDRFDITRQKIAENYVEQLSDNNNSRHFYQINLSLNPFNPKYVSAMRDGYNPTKYSALISVDEYIKEHNPRSKSQKAESNYREYIKNEANMLFTFTPLVLQDKLGVIIRGLDRNLTSMKGFRLDDYFSTLRNLLSHLQILYMKDLNGQQKYIKSEKMMDTVMRKYANLLGKYSTAIFSSGRMENFYKVKNGSLDNIDKIDRMRKRAESNYEKIRFSQKMSATDLMYLKMINSDGKVYLYDNYSVIPTDIQLHTDEKPLKTPFWLKIKDFTIKTDMIDKI